MKNLISRIWIFSKVGFSFVEFEDLTALIIFLTLL